MVSAAQRTINLCDAAFWRGHQAAVGGKDRQLGEVLRGGGIRQPFGDGGSRSWARLWTRYDLYPGADSTSAKLRLRLPKRIGLAGFVDFGNLGDELEVYHFSNFAFAIGGGLRYNSPIGPVRFDLGYKAKDPFRSRENFGLSRYNLHFSLGQAF